jgi:predicted ArsR family transcriptional regulator
MRVLRRSALELGSTQQALLRQLLWHPEGVGVEWLCDKLGVSHNAIRQHLTALGAAGFATRIEPRPSGGRPQAMYAITEAGRELFPRQYGEIAGALIEKLYATLGRDQVLTMLRALGNDMATMQALLAQEPGDTESVTRELAKRMTALGYEAIATRYDGEPQIEAHNCVFHNLAAKHREVCHFDLAFLSAASGREVHHAECMVRGGRCCRFAFGARLDATKAKQKPVGE